MKKSGTILLFEVSVYIPGLLYFKQMAIKKQSYSYSESVLLGLETVIVHLQNAEVHTYKRCKTSVPFIKKPTHFYWSVCLYLYIDYRFN